MTSWRILIVEDDPASWDVLTQLLEHQHITVDVAKSGEEALKFLQQHTYNLAVLDFMLPGMDGWQVLKAIQTNPATKTLNAVAVTAYYSPRIALDARNAGFIECYSKPITSKLVQDIQALLN